MRSWKRATGLWLATAMLGVGAGCRRGPESVATAEFVGREVCASCHAAEARLWRGSHHDLAMQEAGPDSVLGDFEGATVEHGGVSSVFFRRDGRYFVNTEGPDGRLADFQIAYSMGAEPLQQYLVEFPDGRLQALGWCWDARPAEEGGGRWFHLDQDGDADHRDALHWTGPYRNWNHMCAECHSTAVRKNFDPEKREFSTTWSEIDVSCEACHGPGSRHARWAREGGDDPRMGLVSRLGGAVEARWVQDPASGKPRREPRLTSRDEIETCAPCHSRRETLEDGPPHGGPFMQTYAPALLRDGLYYPDGQIRDEVYVYGSFLQSRMYAHGVVCSDCHDPHSLKLKRAGNAVCTSCHPAANFDSPGHHRHPTGGVGAACVDCHMRARVYMVVDPRRDHSFRVPRPDLSVKLGTPNACTGCHLDRGDQWAARLTAEWFGPPRGVHYGEVLRAGERGLPEAAQELERLVRDREVAAIVRATALQLLGEQLKPPSEAVLREAASDPDPLLRRAAAGALARMKPLDRRRLGAPLLEDPMLAVRLEAARLLAAVPRGPLQPGEAETLDRALAEYRKSQRLHADRPESHLNLAELALAEGRLQAAETEYREAIRLAPTHPAAYLNLADVYRAAGREADGERTLREGLSRVDEAASLHHSLGLLLVRRKRSTEALKELETAARLDPENTRFAHVYAVALRSSGRLDLALEVLQSAHRLRDHDPALLLALAAFSQEAGKTEDALRYARRLVELYPEQPAARELLTRLGG